jgi:hypothetical protein
MLGYRVQGRRRPSSAVRSSAVFVSFPTGVAVTGAGAAGAGAVSREHLRGGPAILTNSLEDTEVPRRVACRRLVGLIVMVEAGPSIPLLDARAAVATPFSARLFTYFLGDED